ncbi:MAG: sigma-70 family RNA polymerase sigma factor [Phycisphaerales bacterium]|nr:sigma-70 family RNA polymerase sigma factor [Phycisphaerales bacterium]
MTVVRVSPSVAMLALEPHLPRPPHALSDLTAAAARGDRAAFESLHVRFEPGLRRMFLSRTAGRQDQADDLAQRTWMECWRSVSAGRYDPARAAFSTFVYAVGTNVWREHLRSRARAAAGTSTIQPEEAQGSTGPGGVAELAELLDDLRRGLAGAGRGLSDEDRAVLRAIGAGESDRGMAQRFGVAPSTMNTKKRAALERLRQWLASRGHRMGERQSPGDE